MGSPILTLHPRQATRGSLPSRIEKMPQRGTLPVSRGTPPTNVSLAAIEQAERFKAKAERLEAENNLCWRDFVTWAINAENKGVTMDMLNKPLPKPDRDRSKGEVMACGPKIAEE